jgi:hypothetical protein
LTDAATSLRQYLYLCTYVLVKQVINVCWQMLQHLCVSICTYILVKQVHWVVQRLLTGATSRRL